MTDNEIIKALETCNSMSIRCGNCSYYQIPRKDGKSCSEMMLDDAIDLINRQKAEIERFEKETEQTIHSIREMAFDSIKVAKSEAIKEFAERLKEKKYGGTYPYVLVNEIDNLVEEMAGD